MEKLVAPTASKTVLPLVKSEDQCIFIKSQNYTTITVSPYLQSQQVPTKMNIATMLEITGNTKFLSHKANVIN